MNSILNEYIGKFFIVDYNQIKEAFSGSLWKDRLIQFYKMTKLLFITWDSDQTNYLETLFFPILKALQNKNYVCHVMQFSWAGEDEVNRIQTIADKAGLLYVHFPIHRKLPFLGALLAVFRGVFYIKNHVLEHQIHIVMPRSTMPAIMVNRLQDWLKKNRVKLLFDADGLPLEERIDFTDLDENSIQYKWLKGEEVKILKRANGILTRSNRSTKIHLDKIGKEHFKKFQKVSNGRPSTSFIPSSIYRTKLRQRFELEENDKLFIYSGSLGPQYCLEEMIVIFRDFLEEAPGSKFLFLTRNEDYLSGKIPRNLESRIIPLQIDFDSIPHYLSAADVAFNLRSPAPSLAGLSPIKMGEYLMMGIPVIVSMGIGDLQEILADKPFCFLYDHHDPLRNVKVADWLKNLGENNSGEIMKFGNENFSLDKSINEYSLALSNLGKEFESA